MLETETESIRLHSAENSIFEEASDLTMDLLLETLWNVCMNE